MYQWLSQKNIMVQVLNLNSKKNEYLILVNFMGITHMRGVRIPIILSTPLKCILLEEKNCFFFCVSN